jgi:ribosomal protein L40E/DNA-directed RNA polymerase subunit RPC12/RpoP
MGMSNKTDLVSTQNYGTTECERTISQCEIRILVKENLLSNLKSFWAHNPSQRLERAINIQHEKLNLLRRECAEKIDRACDQVICPSCGSNNSPAAEECSECGQHF